MKVVRAPVHALVLSAVVLAATLCGAHAVAQDGDPPPGVEIYLYVGHDFVEVLDVRELDRAPGTRSPILAARPSEMVPAGTSELWAVLYQRGASERELTPLSVQAFPAYDLHLTDRPRSVEDSEGDLEGAAFAHLVGERVLRVALHPQAVMLLFVRVTAGGAPPVPRHAIRRSSPRRCFQSVATPDGRPEPPAGSELTLQPLGAYGLRSEELRRRLLLRAASAHLSSTLVSRRCIEPLAPRRLPYRVDHLRLCTSGPGHVENVVRVIDNGSTDDKFDIVILGDGFTDADLPAFDGWVDKLVEGMRKTEPFESEIQAGTINVHAVRTVSGVSGISRCPNGDEQRDTYYGVSGSWTTPTGDPGPPTYFGTARSCLIWQTVDAHVAPMDDVESILVVANCPVDGGSALFGRELAFAGTCLPDSSGTGCDKRENFQRIALHEMAHIVGWLGEEYCQCAPYMPAYDFRNIVEEAGAANAWWHNLLLPSEKDSAGGFLVEHRSADGFHANCDPMLSAGHMNMLGLYWGATWGDGAQPSNACASRDICGADASGNPLGRVDENFYRPAFTCRMRKLSSPFCRACEHTLREAIRAP